ncbi:MAG: DUF4349 domain-containing protein [Oscillospiraceae bacterium]|nr:DUF4349 domain-containing protein [Oscillospiraceae bacterium]
MKQLKRILSVFVLTLLCMSLVACGGAAAESEGYSGSNKADYGYSSEAGFDSAGDVSQSITADSAAAAQGLIMTYSAELELETLEYDDSYAALMEAVKAAGGYEVNRESYGGYDESDGSYVRRRLYLTVKIPAEKFQAFLDGAPNIANVTGLRAYSDDITAAYLDTEARLGSLTAQKERLTALLEQANSVAELLEIESQLSHVIYEIESYTSQMNVYKNLAAYSEVTVSLREVSTISPSRNNFFSRLWSTVVDSGRSLLDVAEGLLHFCIYALPYAVIVFLLRRPLGALLERRRARKAARKAAKQSSREAEQH